MGWIKSGFLSECMYCDQQCLMFCDVCRRDVCTRPSCRAKHEEECNA